MSTLPRKLLLLIALCWVAPLAAQQRPVASTQTHAKGCPFAEARARAAAQAHVKASTVIVVTDSGAFGDVPMLGAARRAFQP
jgi:hypothetical protein